LPVTKSTPKTILITGATDGIGRLTANLLASKGHRVLIHGRNFEKLQSTNKEVGHQTKAYLADLSNLNDVDNLANIIAEEHDRLDVLINNAGVLSTSTSRSKSRIGIDLRFVVNTISPFLLTTKLIPLMNSRSRVINVSSAAQQAVNIKALHGAVEIDDDMSAYAQSKLALIQWTNGLSKLIGNQSPLMISVNPGSLLGTKMVKNHFHIEGKPVRIGAEVLYKLSTSNEFDGYSGVYYDNDLGGFGTPHPNALDDKSNQEIINSVQRILRNKANLSLSAYPPEQARS